jgi:hypothetical protein
MKILKIIFDFYINSSLHVAIAVFCLVNITIVANHLDKHLLFSTCVFFGTILGYNFLKYFQIYSSGFFHSKKYYSILLVSLLAAIGFLYSFYFLEYTFQKLILISGVFVLLYPFLRKYGWLKLFLVSFVVTFVTVYIPFQTDKYSVSELCLNLLQRFFILISLLIPFEIMDSKTDSASLGTLPQHFGIKTAKVFGILLVFPFIGLEFLKVHPSYLVLLVGIITVCCINFTTFDKNKYYTSFWVESVPILWWILILLFS